MSFLLNGDKMRERLAKMLELAQDAENTQEKNDDGRRSSGIPRTGTFE